MLRENFKKNLFIIIKKIIKTIILISIFIFTNFNKFLNNFIKTY